MLMLLMFLIFPSNNFVKLSLSLIMNSFLMMYFSLNFFPSNVSMNLCCDILSYFMILLTIFIFSLSILSSKKLMLFKYFFIINMILLKIVIIFFLSMNLLMFYIFFELSLIPMMMIILGWGMKVERFQAGMYFMFYTMFSSLPLLYELINYMYMIDSGFLYMMNNLTFLDKDFMLIFFFLFAFLVKMPVFFFHVWLPKAHVEAPVSGSMILAGILLKLGGYGLMRVMYLLMESMYKYSYFFMSFSLWGGLIISFSCLNQIDLKMIVAFSSVSHMSLLICGLFSMNKLGLYGSFLIMVSHGLTSSGLFMLVNIFYERTSSRSLNFNKGLINISPNLSFSSFLMISASMAAPPTINLLSEFLLIYSSIFMNSLFMIIMFFMMLISVGYSMYMYSFNQHGKLFKGMYFFKYIYMLEYLIIFMHWIPANFFIITSEYLTLYF